MNQRGKAAQRAASKSIGSRYMPKGCGTWRRSNQSRSAPSRPKAAGSGGGRVRQQPGWTVREIATGHCPMVSRPDELVRRLLEAAAC